MLILLPPSEGKRDWWHADGERLSVSLAKPLHIATTASEKNLKCTGARYAEGIRLNQTVKQWPRMTAIDRYDGVMYRAIDYPWLSEEGKEFFDTHVRILSGMYGIASPTDQIANYKLPVTTALARYRKQTLTDHINSIEAELIIDLLPWSYRNMIDRKQICAHVSTVERRKPDGKKISHGVKGIKGRWLHDLCETQGAWHDRSQDIIVLEVE